MTFTELPLWCNVYDVLFSTRYASQAGLVLTLLVGIMYKLAISYEEWVSTIFAWIKKSRCLCVMGGVLQYKYLFMNYM